MKASRPLITFSLFFLVSFKFFFAATDLSVLEQKNITSFERLIQAAELKSSMAIRFDGQLNKIPHSASLPLINETSLYEWPSSQLNFFFISQDFRSTTITQTLFIRAPTISFLLA